MQPEHPAETEVTRVALAFATALARGEWSAAHSMLAPRLRDDWQPADLQRMYGKMTSYWDKPATSVEIGIADMDACTSQSTVIPRRTALFRRP